MSRHFGIILLLHRTEDPSIAVADAESAVAAARAIYQHDPRLLITVLLKEIGISHEQITAITGRPRGTISRSKCRAQVLLKKS